MPYTMVCVAAPISLRETFLRLRQEKLVSFLSRGCTVTFSILNEKIGKLAFWNKKRLALFLTGTLPNPSVCPPKYKA